MYALTFLILYPSSLGASCNTESSNGLTFIHDCLVFDMVQHSTMVTKLVIVVADRSCGRCLSELIVIALNPMSALYILY